MLMLINNVAELKFFYLKILFAYCTILYLCKTN